MQIPIRPFAASILLFGFTVLTVLTYQSHHDQEGDPSALPESEKPALNVLLIVVDDLGYADIGAYNPDSFYETPNIDRLAQEGVKFTDGYAANPVCSPSRLALVTGKHPTRLAATDWFHKTIWPHREERYRPARMIEYLPLEEVTIAEALKEGGYQTAFLGKWHLGEEERLWPEYQGFDINIGGTEWGQPPGGFFSPYKNPRLHDGKHGEYLTERLTSEAIKLIDEYSAANDPFFVQLSFYTVHTPLEAPQETVAKYEEKKQHFLWKENDDFIPEEQVFLADTPRMVRIRQNHATYAAMVEHMDHNVGRMLDHLHAKGLADNTVVIFTSDNGGLSTAEGSPTSNLPLRGGKGWLYEGGIRVPFIIRMPGAVANSLVTDTPVIGMDIYPTILSLAGLPLMEEQHMDGVSLTPLLEGKHLSERPLFFHYPHYANQGGFPGAVMRSGNWKLVQRFEDGRLHLYNLKNDIGEQNDVAMQETERVSQMRAQLYDWYKDVDARCLRPLKNAKAVKPWCYK